MTSRDLLEKRASLISEMRKITDAASGDGGDLSAEQATKFDSLKTELDGIEKRIDRQKLLDEAERRMQGDPINGNGSDHFEAEARNFSLRRAICSMVPDLARSVDCGREREISQEVAKRSGLQFQGVPVPMQVFEKRVVTTALPAGGPGGTIIPTDYLAGEYIDILRNALVLRRLGARVLSNLVGNIEIPALTKSAVAGWVAENSALTPTDPEWDPVSLTPKHVGCLTEFSRNLLLQSSPDIEDLLRSDFAQVLAEAVDRAGIVASTTNGPTGILGSGLDTTTSFTTPSWTAVLTLIEKLALGNGTPQSFLTNPKVVRKLRATPKVASTDSVMIMESPDSLAGYPLANTNLVPSNLTPGTLSALIFGNFTDVLLGYWSAFDLLVNPYAETPYSKGNVQVRGMVTMDIKVRHSASFVASVDVATT